jgi:hypothetical protein
MERMQIQFTALQAERLREQARQRGVSIATLVREAVDVALRDAALQSPSQGERWTRSRAAAGRFAGSRREAASELHDEDPDEVYGS